MANSKIERWFYQLAQPLPPQMDGSKTGTWAHYSIVQRLPEIGQRILKENEFQLDVERAIRCFLSEIPNTTIQPLTSYSAPDSSAWDDLIRHHSSKNWLQAPWFFVEFYFYRRILDIIGYFDEGKYLGYDPFFLQKQIGLFTALGPVSQLCEYLSNLSNTASHDELFTRVFELGVIGNHKDLSLYPVDTETENTTNTSVDHFFDGLRFVVNDLDLLKRFISDVCPKNVDFLIDNAGFEFLCDLVLIDYLVNNLGVEKVTLHIKPYPIFVSDLTLKDYHNTFDVLEKTQNGVLQKFGNRLKRSFEEQKICIRDDLFWGMPYPMWKMPVVIFQHFLGSDLIISKGDANFRRFVGDLSWNFEHKVSNVLGYLPTPVFLMRVLKSETGIGYPAGFAQERFIEDPEWMYGGKWSSMQFYSLF